MAYRVIQWATGNVGRLAIEAVLAHPELELAGVWVHSPDKAGEFSDIRNYQAEAVVRDIMLFGKPLEQAAESPMLDILGSGFSQSVRMVGDALGLNLEPELRTGHEMAVATKDLDTPVGLIEAGTVAAQRFTWIGTVGG